MKRSVNVVVIVGLLLLFQFALFLDDARAAGEVSIANFNVVGGPLTSNGQTLNFKITLSQSDQNLDCDTSSGSKGSLEYVVVFDWPGHSSFIPKKTVALPLGNSPKNLDFSYLMNLPETAMDASSVSFRLLAACSVSTVNYSNNLAASSPVSVTVNIPANSRAPRTSGGAQTISSAFTVPNWLKGQPTSIAQLLDIIARWLFNLSIPIAVALIIWAGVVFMTAGADPSKVKKGKDILKWVAIGFAIILINKGFISLIKSIIELGS